MDKKYKVELRIIAVSDETTLNMSRKTELTENQLVAAIQTAHDTINVLSRMEEGQEVE